MGSDFGFRISCSWRYYPCVANLLRQIEETIHTRRLFSRGETIVAGVSGGVDSMVLLHLLSRLAGRNRWHLVAAHVNHQLRGRSSTADEAFVRETAVAWGIPVRVEKVDVRARQRKVSLEMAARELRHEALDRMAVAAGASALALAHHADDQVELFFLRLLRGAGGRGLGGMQWRRSTNSGLGLVRPLLASRKADLIEYARREGIAFREDSSNTQVRILRNRIRLRLLPFLQDEFGVRNFRSILRSMEIVGAEAAYVEKTARAWLAGSRRLRFDRLEPAVQRRCLQQGLFQFGIEPEFELIERLRAAAGQPCSCPGGLEVHRDERGQVHLERKPAGGFGDQSTRLDLRRESGRAAFEGLAVRWRVREPPRRLLRRPGKTGAAQEWFDADRIGDLVWLRYWRPGDRFQPIGFAHQIKLQDFFTNQKVPRHERHRLVLATTAAGQVFWVEGLRISERFKVSDGTRRSLSWSWGRQADLQGARLLPSPDTRL